MTSQESNLIRHAIALLQKLAPSDEPSAVDYPTRRDPIMRFVQQYLTQVPDTDVSCNELWAFYSEISASRELPPMRKATFFRKLPAALEMTYGAKKCHSISRDGRTLRGFKSVTIREHTSPVGTLEVEPE
jgi:hypothetical protein